MAVPMLPIIWTANRIIRELVKATNALPVPARRKPITKVVLMPSLRGMVVPARGAMKMPGMVETTPRSPSCS